MKVAKLDDQTIAEQLAGLKGWTLANEKLHRKLAFESLPKDLFYFLHERIRRTSSRK